MQLMKKMFNSFWLDLKNEWRLELVILLPVFLILIFLDSHFLNIGFLEFHSIDEYAFHGSLLNMYQGFIHLSPPLFFRTGFYSYGFFYFLVNFIFTLPFLATANTAWVIFIPKAITSFFATAALLYTFKFFRLYINKIISSAFLLILILMPGFWGFATWFHPDWVMTAFLAMTIYFLAKDKFEFLENYWLAILTLGLALVTKFQAITFIPLLFLYDFQGLNFKEIVTWKNRLSIFVKSALALGFLFIVGNPYILHPMGLQVFRNSLADNMISNATNHGAVGAVSLGSKIILTVGGTFLNPLVLVLAIAVAGYFVFRYFKKADIFTILAGNFLINLCYLLFFVNKGWGWYYLPVILSGILLLIPIAREVSFKKQIIFVILVIFLNLFSNYKNLIGSFNISFDKKSIANFQAQSDNIVAALRGLVDPKNDHILISPLTGFDFEKLGLKYDQIIHINGAFSMAMLDQNIYNNQVSAKFGEGSGAYRPFFKKNFIILRKDDNYFNLEMIAKMFDQKAYNQANDLIAQLKKGEYGCSTIADSDLVLIFQCK